MKTMFTVAFAFCITVVTAQNTKPLLGAIFPVDNIEAVKVINFSGKHTLTKVELNQLRIQLKKAKPANGLLTKPGHILLEIIMKDDVIAKPGFVYASTGEIHFESGIDQFNQHFSGTFILPQQINFDNYK